MPRGTLFFDLALQQKEMPVLNSLTCLVFEIEPPIAAMNGDFFSENGNPVVRRDPSGHTKTAGAERKLSG